MLCGSREDLRERTSSSVRRWFFARLVAMFALINSVSRSFPGRSSLSSAASPMSNSRWMAAFFSRMRSVPILRMTARACRIFLVRSSGYGGVPYGSYHSGAVEILWPTYEEVEERQPVHHHAVQLDGWDRAEYLAKRLVNLVGFSIVVQCLEVESESYKPCRDSSCHEYACKPLTRETNNIEG